jgi:hypothetical protein
MRTLMHIRVVDLALALALVTAGQPAQAPGPGIDEVGWLQGCWALSANGRTVEEQWMAPRGGTMLGMGRTIRGDRLVEYELVLLRAEGGRIAYEAHPSGQPAATFLSITVSASELVVENKAHDFPQRVGYKREGDVLNAWIEGTSNGKPRRVDFPYRRTTCPGD